jgi:hypothetical protein
LEYIELIGTNMGFNVQRDILRIPSSKRVCLIGQSRSYPPSNEDVIETKRCLFIQSRCTGGGHHPTTITVGAVSHDGHMTDDDDDVTVSTSTTGISTTGTRSNTGGYMELSPTMVVFESHEFSIYTTDENCTGHVVINNEYV